MAFQKGVQKSSIDVKNGKSTIINTRELSVQFSILQLYLFLQRGYYSPGHRPSAVPSCLDQFLNALGGFCALETYRRCDDKHE